MLSTGKIQHMTISKIHSYSPRDTPLHHPVVYSSHVKICFCISKFFFTGQNPWSHPSSLLGRCLSYSSFSPFQLQKKQVKTYIRINAFSNPFAAFGQIFLCVFTYFLPVSVMLLYIIGVVHNKLIRLAWKWTHMLKWTRIDTLTIVGRVSLWVITEVCQHRSNLSHICHHVVRYTPNPP